MIQNFFSHGVITVEDEVCTPSFDAIKSLLSNENVTDTTKVFTPIIPNPVTNYSTLIHA